MLWAVLFAVAVVLLLRPAIRKVPRDIGEAPPDGDAVATAAVDGEAGVCVALLVGELPQAARPSIKTRATPLARTA